MTTILISAFTFDTMMTSTMVAPALYQIAKDLNVPNEATMQLVLSSYVLAYAFGPFLWGPASECFGRLVTLQIASAWFLLWNIVCGFARTKSVLIAGRVFSGMGASAALAISTGVLGDCWKPEQRGRSLAVYTFIPMLGPTIGPILGGVIVQHSIWRWSFWSTSAFDALLQVLAVLLLRETHHATVLRRKARKLLTSANAPACKGVPVKQAMLSALRRPFRLLSTQLVLALLAVFSGTSFGILYLVLSVLPSLFTRLYGQSDSIAAVIYISVGIGFAVGAQGLAFSTDFMYRRESSRATPTPEVRLALLLPSITAAALGLICVGWSAHTRTHWIVPNIGIVVFGAGTQFSTQCTTAYVMDVYGELGWSASAMAGIWALKSVAGFGFPLFGPGLMHVFGWGWSCSILATALLAIGAPVSIGLRWHGHVFRRMGERKLRP